MTAKASAGASASARASAGVRSEADDEAVAGIGSSAEASAGGSASSAADALSASAGVSSGAGGSSESAAPWEREPILSVEHLTMRFGGLVAVSDLSFHAGRGDITALIGPNGAGKTTVFNCVTGFYKPTEGRIAMRHGKGRMDALVEKVTNSSRQFGSEGEDWVFLLERMPDFRIASRAKLARTFQNIRLFAGMTALENLMVAQHNALMRASLQTFGGVLGLPGYVRAEREACERAAHWLGKTDLLEKADDPAAGLSYGEQRRLEIARAMCSDPHLLCLDEPAAGLNPRETSQLNELLLSLREEDGVSVLLIEHDMRVVMEVSDHVVVLDHGEGISDGEREWVRNDPKVITAYLGVEEEETRDPEVAHLVEEAQGLGARGEGKEK